MFEYKSRKMKALAWTWPRLPIAARLLIVARFSRIKAVACAVLE